MWLILLYQHGLPHLQLVLEEICDHVLLASTVSRYSSQLKNRILK